MTLSVTTDHALIRKTIRDWLQTYSGLANVDYADQTVSRAVKPYATILITSSGVKTGLDEHRETFDVPSDVIQRITAGPRLIFAQCEVYTEPAADPNTLEAAEILENALLALETVTVQNTFRAAKIGLMGHTPIVRMDEQLGERWERRALSDVTFSYSGEMFDDGLTGEAGNWVESVEIPTEENGNATYNE